MDAEPTDDLPLIRFAVHTRQSVVRAGDAPALASCAVQRTLCTEFIKRERNSNWKEFTKWTKSSESHGAQRSARYPRARRARRASKVAETWGVCTGHFATAA